MTVVHGEWCGAKTYPTTCRTCSADVFYFSCGHGSKVFFKELGPPWPIHDCEEAREEAWARGLKRFTDQNGDTVVELKPGIRVIRSLDKPASFGIEQDIIASARTAKRKKAQHPIVPIEPERELKESHEGFLREIRPSVDPLKAFGVPDTAPGRAWLGSIGKEEMGKITVHVPYPTEDYTESFTSWIPAKLLRARRVKRGVMVAARFRSVLIVGHGHTWYCDGFEVL